MQTSHPSSRKPTKPTRILALICLAIVHRFRPGYLAVSLTQAARADGVNPQHLSRLATGAIALFEKAAERLTRRGRPRRDRAQACDVQQAAIETSLLKTATTLLAHVPWKKRIVRDLAIGAYQRLRETNPGLTQERFCEALGLSSRTLRAWLAADPKAKAADKHQAAAGSEPHAPANPPRPTLRRPRFGFDVTVADLQVAADTTDLSAFGVALKLVAAQDVGGRDQDLFDAIVVDDHESAQHVIDVLERAVGDNEGMQVITDQGSPYMAEATTQAIAAMGAEHAPQREADPIGKATLERAFRTVKSIGEPIFAMTCQLAEKFACLRNPDLAKHVTHLLLCALLRAYQAGARAARRADDARANMTREQMAAVAEQARNAARAEDRSVRLTATRIHQTYAINRPLNAFVKSMRRFSPTVLLQAERDFARQAHRDDIRDRASYFAALASNHHNEMQCQHARTRREQEALQRARGDANSYQEQLEAWRADPHNWLKVALRALAAQWDAAREELLFGGIGVARAWLHGAIDLLLSCHGPSATADIAAGTLRALRNQDGGPLAPRCAQALTNVINDHLAPVTAVAAQTALPKIALRSLSAMIKKTGPPTRPIAPVPLRI